MADAEPLLLGYAVRRRRRWGRLAIAVVVLLIGGRVARPTLSIAARQWRMLTLQRQCMAFELDPSTVVAGDADLPDAAPRRLMRALAVRESKEAGDCFSDQWELTPKCVFMGHLENAKGRRLVILYVAWGPRAGGSVWIEPLTFVASVIEPAGILGSPRGRSEECSVATPVGASPARPPGRDDRMTLQAAVRDATVRSDVRLPYRIGTVRGELRLTLGDDDHVRIRDVSPDPVWAPWAELQGDDPTPG